MERFCTVVLIVFFHISLIVSSNSTSKAGNYAAPIGSTVRLSCIPPGVLVDKSQVSERRSFLWMDEEGHDIANPRMTTLKTGELEIVRAHEGDSGVYHCKFRPVAALSHQGAPSKIFEHKLIVYEMSGHKFQSIVAFDVTEFGSETTITLLRDLMKSKICAFQLCSPGPVISEDCEVSETEKQMCAISVTYEAIEPTQTAKCNEKCVREIMIEKLKKAQKILESSLLIFSEDSQSRLRPDMHSFETKHIITCKAGYHLIESNYEHCFPCLPGTFSEVEALRCEMCPVGFYQEKYGSYVCDQCPNDKTTEMAGSKSRDECRPLGETGVFKDIREGIAAIFRG